MNIVSGGKTDKGDYLFLCDTKVAWLKSREELMKMHGDFLEKFAKQHDGSVTALALIPMAMQISVFESTVPKFESGDVHSNRMIRVRSERAGDSIIVTSVTPSDFMVGTAGSAVDQLLETIEAIESNKLLPTSTENATIDVNDDSPPVDVSDNSSPVLTATVVAYTRKAEWDHFEDGSFAAYDHLELKLDSGESFSVAIPPSTFPDASPLRVPGTRLTFTLSVPLDGKTRLAWGAINNPTIIE